MNLAILGVLCMELLLGVGSCYPVENTMKTYDLDTVCVQITNKSNRNEKAPILLLHGMFGFKETWYGFMQFLAFRTGRKVCAADLRNHGDSPWSEDFNTNFLAKDIERLLKTHNMTKIILLGHSLGGKTSVQFTLTNPEKVEKLIIEDMRPNGILENPEVKKMLNFTVIAKAALEAIPKGATEKEAKRAVYMYFKAAFESNNQTYELDDITVDNYPIKCSNGKCVWKANVDRLSRALLDLQGLIPDSHGLFNGPALFIYGEKSLLRVWEAKDEIMQLFPKSELFGIKNGGHNLNKLPEYKENVLKFILK